MTASPDPIPGLRDQLLAGGARLHARRRRRQERFRRAAAAAAFGTVFAVAVVVAFSWGGSEPASASVIVARVDGMWEVVVAGDDATAAMVEAALADRGVDGTVDAVPVGPSRVGQFVSGDGAVAPAGGRLSASTVRFPGDSRTVRLLFGRPAGPGEPYAAFSDAFAAGEPLACVDNVWGEPVGTALQVVNGVFDQVTVVGEDGRPGALDGMIAEVVVPEPGRAVVWVHTSTPVNVQRPRPPRCPSG